MHDTPFHQSLRLANRMTLIAVIVFVLAGIQVIYSKHQVTHDKSLSSLVKNGDSTHHRSEKILANSKKIVAFAGPAMGLGLLLMIVFNTRIIEHEKFRFTREPTRKVYSVLLTGAEHSMLSSGLLALAFLALVYPILISKFSGDFFWHSELFKFSPLWALPICLLFSFLYAKKGSSIALFIIVKLAISICILIIALGILFFFIAILTFSPTSL